VIGGRVLVAGSGKMARNVGFFLIRRGWEVSWASRDAARLAEIERLVGRRLKSTGIEAAAPKFVIAGADQVPEVDVLLESTQEDAPAKTEMIEALVSRSPRRPVVLSNSSSILPRDIHPDCAGLHFFYPVETTGIAEVVMPEREPAGAWDAIRRIAESCAIELVIETETTAFAANRMLLSLQAEACRAVMAGCAASDVDASTRSELLATGTLALMDSVGLDVVLPAARNYLSRMGDDEAAAHGPIVDCLDAMVRSGKCGSKNRNGFLVGEPLPWPASQAPVRSAEVFHHLFLNACATAADEGVLKPREIDLILSSLHGSSKTLDEVVSSAGAEHIGRSLGGLHLETGRSYFRAASRFQGR
jgi:3-hydroxybutyryl-CoA dehydrogenase